MQYKAVILDVDGTLLVNGESCVRPAVAQAVQKVQKMGVKVVIATGRTHYAISPDILGGIVPDYAVCANGAQVVDKSGKNLFMQSMTAEEMYALVDYFEDFNYPLTFSFSDKYYAYVEYQKMKGFYHESTGHGELILDGEDQDRHLENMPFGAFAILPPAALEEFQQQYGYLGLQFIPYLPGYYDVMQKGVTKATGLQHLMEFTGWTKDEVVSMGDNDNDVPLMQFLPLSYAMENGSEQAKANAARIAPSVQQEGVKTVLEELFLHP